MVGRAFVAVVDDDESVRESLPDLLAQFGLAAQSFASAEELLASGRASEAQCLILDVTMIGMSGPDLFQELRRRGIEVPVIFITAHGDDTTGRRLVEHGAVACLLKPFSDTALRDALETALRASGASGVRDFSK